MKTGREALAEYETELFGDSPARMDDGRVERGSGSHFQARLSEAQRKCHSALERLIVLEDAYTSAAIAVEDAEKAQVAAWHRVLTLRNEIGGLPIIDSLREPPQNPTPLPPSSLN